MNRLQKKCFIFSAGFHLSLLLILIVGPAFFSPTIKSGDLPPIDFIPANVIDGVPNAGAGPKAPPPPPPPPPVVRHEQKPPEKAREPDPPKEEAKSKEADSLEPTRELKQHKIEVSTKQVTRKTNSPTTKKETSEADSRARELADARRRMADLIGKTARSLRNDVSTTTEVEMPGGGGFGEAVASYAQIVKSIYEHAWLPPDDTASDDAITKVTVTIARDGNVVSARILKASGDSSVDRSVQRTLDRVTFIEPFPKGATDKERTYTINFNLRAKRALG